MKRLDQRAAQPLDIEGVARDEVLQVLDALERARKLARAAAHGLALLAHRGRLERARAHMRKRERARMPRALIENDAYDLRNHVARALHDHRVADADVLARDFILVVQRRVGDDDAPDRDGLQLRYRRHRARAAHLNVDGFEDRLRLLRREFMRDGPAWRTRDESQPLLPIQPVDLINDTVDVVTEIGTFRLDPRIEGKHIPD